MPYKERPVEKLFWSIGEVASELGVNPSLIRYWEKEFSVLRPRRTGRGDRLFTRKDIDQLKRIQYLVKEKGFTLSGAKEELRRATAEKSAAHDRQAEVLRRLERVRQELIALRAALDQE
jgi:DNA-binding transcriptional MerR regulator